MKVKKKQLISRATDILRERDTRKTVPAAKTKLHIHDEEGNESTFVVKCERKGYLLNEQDVAAVLDALLETLVEAMRRGDTVALTGIGTFGPHYRAARAMNSVEGGRIISNEHLVPRYWPGQSVKMAVKMYESTLNGDFSGFRTKPSPTPEEEENGD